MFVVLHWVCVHVVHTYSRTSISQQLNESVNKPTCEVACHPCYRHFSFIVSASAVLSRKSSPVLAWPERLLRKNRSERYRFIVASCFTFAHLVECPCKITPARPYWSLAELAWKDTWFLPCFSRNGLSHVPQLTGTTGDQASLSAVRASDEVNRVLHFKF